MFEGDVLVVSRATRDLPEGTDDSQRHIETRGVTPILLGVSRRRVSGYSSRGLGRRR